MTSYRFYKIAAIASQIYLRFLFGHVWHLGRPRAVGIPNFDQISQSTAEILLLRFSENKRPLYWNSTSGFDFGLFTVIGRFFCTGIIFYANRMIADEVMTSYWFYNEAAIASQIYIRFQVWLRLTSPYQISTKCLNLRPRYYYFRFLETNGRNIEILLPVSFLCI